MTRMTFDLQDGGVARDLGRLVRASRALARWTQRELATRARTSQATIWRLETGTAASLDLVVVNRVLAALGLRPTLVLEDRHLDDRRRQRDAVHAVVTGHVARRLERSGWRVATEVEVGESGPRGWIDLLAFRPQDRTLLVEETKADLPDLGALLRSLAFYQREAWMAARRLGWDPVRSQVLVVALDSATMADRLHDNRELVLRAVPARVADVATWLGDPSRDLASGWCLGTCDPASRQAAWLRPTMLGGRRRPPRYRDYAHAASELLGWRHRPDHDEGADHARPADRDVGRRGALRA